MARYLIIGGVAGGATAAARLRRLDEKAEIVIFERGGHVSYANCGLPYYIGNIIRHRRRLFVQTREGFRSRYNIDVRLNTEVTRIVPDKKTIEFTDLSTGESAMETYDKLILSPGAYAIKPPIPGINDEKIFMLRNVSDTDKIHNYIKEDKPDDVCIVGAGFIGLEMAENLHQLGIKVSIVEMLDQVLGVIDYEMAALVQKHLLEKDVELHLKDGVTAFAREGEKVKITLGSGKKLTRDFVLLSIGVRPEARLAGDAALAIGESKGIVVNEYLQTSDPDIYALGDAIEYTNPLIGKSMIIPLAGPANKQGRIAADNIVFGNTVKYKGTVGTAIAKVFDLTVGSTGLSHRLLDRFGIHHFQSITHDPSHAEYYPEPGTITVKLLFSEDEGKILGAQVIGKQGADKRIDMIAAVLNGPGTVYDLHDIEHAYAPPYSSAKDPVTIAGYVAENILKGLMKSVQWSDIKEHDPDTVLIDVRTRGEYKQGTIEGAVNIPIDDLRQRIEELPADKKIIVFCAVGARAYLACRILSQSGFKDVYNLSGGYETYGPVAGS
ncbi:MAG: FAD-dependent oxidoreductase [Spirochaetales bacterium]|nr:FAD-dependent oxidoreductase [Spirochaetales bacterium]